MWRVALNATVSRVLTDALLFNRYGTPGNIAIVCSVGEERISPYVGALCLACGRSQWKHTRTEGWLANATRNERL